MYPAHWKQHLECEKHKNNGIRKTRSDKVFEPNCKLCDYTTMRTTNMKLHYLNNHANKEERSLNITAKIAILVIFQKDYLSCIWKQNIQ